MRPGLSSNARGHSKRGGGGGGRGHRQQHALKSKGKAKGPRALDVALNQRLASWQVAAINAGAPSSAGVEYYLAEYLGWEDETDEAEVRDERYVQCWDDGGFFGEPEAHGGAVGDEECDLPEFQGCWEGEGLPVEWAVEGVLPDRVRMWGTTRVAAGDYNADVTEGAMAELEREEVTEGEVAEEEDQEQEQELEEAARVGGNYEMMVKWKKRKQQWKMDLLQEEEAAEEEEHQSDIYQHTKKMKQQQERRTLYDDNEEEEEEDCMEPGEMLKKDVEDRVRVMGTEKEREDPEELVAMEQQETGVEKVEQQGPDDDFCRMGFAWDYVEEEDWYVVGGIVEM